MVLMAALAASGTFGPFVMVAVELQWCSHGVAVVSEWY
jgi:hypothetical protein